MLEQRAEKISLFVWHGKLKPAKSYLLGYWFECFPLLVDPSSLYYYRYLKFFLSLSLSFLPSFFLPFSLLCLSFFISLFCGSKRISWRGGGRGGGTGRGWSLFYVSIKSHVRKQPLWIIFCRNQDGLFALQINSKRAEMDVWDKWLVVRLWFAVHFKTGFDGKAYENHF